MRATLSADPDRQARKKANQEEYQQQQALRQMLEGHAPDP